MTTTKVREPKVDDYICVYLKHGWIQIKVESEGVVINTFNCNDDPVITWTIPNEELAPRRKNNVPHSL